MANIVLLLVIIMLVFSVIGVTLFRDVVPMYFGNLSSCIFSYNCFPYSEWGGGGRGIMMKKITLGHIAVPGKLHQRQAL